MQRLVRIPVTLILLLIYEAMMMQTDPKKHRNPMLFAEWKVFDWIYCEWIYCKNSF